MCFFFLLLLLLDTIDDDERACKCKVNAKLYMTIIRNLDNDAEVAEGILSVGIITGSRKTKCFNFRVVESSVDAEAVLDTGGDDDDDDDDDEVQHNGVVVALLSFISLLSSKDSVSIADLLVKLIVNGAPVVEAAVMSSFSSSSQLWRVFCVCFCSSTITANGFNISKTAVNDFTAASYSHCRTNLVPSLFSKMACWIEADILLVVLIFTFIFMVLNCLFTVVGLNIE